MRYSTFLYIIIRIYVTKVNLNHLNFINTKMKILLQKNSYVKSNIKILFISELKIMVLFFKKCFVYVKFKHSIKISDIMKI